MTQKFRLSHELLDLQASDVAYLLRNFSPNACHTHRPVGDAPTPE